MPTYTDLPEEVRQYIQVVDDLYGHYLDSIVGFDSNARILSESQEKLQHELPPESDQDSCRFIYGDGDPTREPSRVQHITTQGAFKSRNVRGGKNHVRAAQLLVVLIFEFWESDYRARIAMALKLPNQNALKIPILGDLRVLRQDVIHHGGIIRKETTRKLKVISGLRAGNELVLDAQNVEHLVVAVKAALDELMRETGLPDPEFRKTLQIQ